MDKDNLLKWKILFLWLILIFSFGCKDNSPPQSAGMSEKNRPRQHSMTIVALGDSLTAGLGVDADETYPALLGKKLLSNGYGVKVINAGGSGETSSGTVSRIHWVISALKPDGVILVIGANDGMRGIDTDLLSDNLDKILTILKENNIKVILGGMRMLPNLGPVYASAFEGVYRKMAKKHHIPLIPFFLEGVAGESHLNQADGIHPTAKGYKIIVDHIYPYVVQIMNDK